MFISIDLLADHVIKYYLSLCIYIYIYIYIYSLLIGSAK